VYLVIIIISNITKNNTEQKIYMVYREKQNGKIMMANTFDDIDWNTVWKSRMHKNLSSRGDLECSRIWEDRDAAQCYDAGVCSDGRKRALDLIGRIGLSSDSRVLDIGAGLGTHTIPLANIVNHVTAIEKMNDATSDRVYLIWPAGPTMWERNYAEIWPKLHDRDYYPGPKVDCLFNMLCQMSIYPNVTTYEDEYVEKYSGMDEAVERSKIYYNVSTEHQLSILRDYLMKKFHQDKGLFIWNGSSTMAMISWHKSKDMKRYG